jgi:hypothetical protein
MKSECYCPKFSCESCVSNDKRFRYEKEDNCIVDGGVVHGCIESCPIRQSGEFQLKPYTKEQLAHLACSGTVTLVTGERHKKRHAKKKGGKR